MHCVPAKPAEPFADDRFMQTDAVQPIDLLKTSLNFGGFAFGLRPFSVY